MSCHVVGQTNLETALYAYIFEYFVTTSASTVIQHIRGRLPLGLALPFFSKMNGYIFISLLFLCGCVYFTIVPTKVCAPALFKIYTV